MRKYAHMGSFSRAAHFNVIDHNAALVGSVTIAHESESDVGLRGLPEFALQIDMDAILRPCS